MKKSELVSKVDVDKMTQDFDLYYSSIKLAIVGPVYRVDTKFIDNITSLERAKKLFWRTKDGFPLRKTIALKVIELCKSLDDMNDMYAIPRSEIHPEVTWTFVKKLKSFLRIEIDKATNFDSFCKLWMYDTSGEFTPEEDKEVFRKMCNLAQHTPPDKVILSLGGFWSREGSPHFEVAMIACNSATPEQAKQALINLKEFVWNGEEETFPIRVLIKKASTLYPA